MKESKYASTGRNNVGMSVNPTSLIPQGDFPTKCSCNDADSHNWPLDVDVHPDGDLTEGVSSQECMYEEPGVIYVI